MKLLRKIINVLFNTADNTGGSEKPDVYIQSVYDVSEEELFDRTQEMSKKMDIMERRHHHRYF